jgi:glycosyltransferase involved in cell wall biosynthesis
MKLVCIPAYNEESHIENIVKLAKNYVDSVIVCDDCSTDDTANIAKKAGAVVISHKTTQGYGASIISLFDYARKNNAEIMITIDGDGQHNPDEIPLFLDTLTRHKVDVVIGSRFLNQKTKVPGYRKRGIKIITSAANFGADLNVSDSQSGFRAYSKNAINVIHPTEEGMSASTEILLKISNNGLSLAEVPITISYDGDTSKHNPLSHGVSVLVNTLKYISIKRPLLFYAFPGFVFLIAGLIAGVMFIDAYLLEGRVFFGSLLAAVVLFLLGAILCVTAVILFSMANLIRHRY